MRDGLSSGPTQKVVTGGLCETCGSRPMCMYLRAAEAPILQCEEYEEHGASVPGERGRAAQVWLETHQPAPEGALDLIGLCRTCEERATCMHLKRSGAGVWQCEDYR
jgi:hypothetical protein